MARIWASPDWRRSEQALRARCLIENETEPLRGVDQGKPWAALRGHGADLDRHWVVRIC